MFLLYMFSVCFSYTVDAALNENLDFAFAVYKFFVFFVYSFFVYSLRARVSEDVFPKRFPFDGVSTVYDVLLFSHSWSFVQKSRVVKLGKIWGGSGRGFEAGCRMCGGSRMVEHTGVCSGTSSATELPFVEQEAWHQNGYVQQKPGTRAVFFSKKPGTRTAMFSEICLAPGLRGRVRSQMPPASLRHTAVSTRATRLGGYHKGVVHLEGAALGAAF